MKILTMTAALVVSVLAHAGEAPKFSAFSTGDNLYVTILADSCNNLFGTLSVDDNCKEDRFTRNWAIQCSAEVRVSSTKMACHDSTPVPRVLTMSLKENNVAKESKILKLSFSNQAVKVQLDRQLL